MDDDDAGTPRPPQPQHPMAIVGYSHRLPGGLRTDDDFWRLLSEREIVQEPVTDRYGRGYRPVGGFSGPGRFASPWEGLIREDRERLFDRSLFGMSHNEMLVTDPQLRMLLSCAWEAIERAGWDLRSLRNSSTGVFIGGQLPAVANWRPLRGVNEFAVTSISLAMLANRISYHFNLKGPSTTYCTACSASLTALHAAMNALQSGDCEQAVVGSVNYLGSARLSISFNALGVISPDGKCHSFDAEANGYMRSEGAFVFAMKPLAAAERDGDHVHAVVEATAVNAAGAADGSGGLAPGRYITAPTRHAQVDLMRTARVRAGRTRRDFDYIEAHATGTVVGDRIEGNAITEAYGGVEREIPLRVSSVKSNVGHMEAAAFHCALLKVVLMMRRRTFAPTSRNFLVPNPEIDFDGCPMQVQTACEPFPERPVVVGVNSFGFGGANGHCVVREYRPTRPRVWSVPPAAGGVMIPLSARSPAALTRSARALRARLDEHDFELHTLAGNLGRRRTHFAARASFAVRGRRELSDALDAFAEDPAPIATVDEGRKRIAMVFSGQGTQWAGCGRDLYDADPVFRRVVDAVEAHWREHSDISLRDACFRARQDDLDEVRLAQPVIFMVECALVELLKTWGVHPDCVIGHSSGEVAAAYACGALSLGDATRLVFHRATLQQRTAGSGRMLAVGLDRTGVEDLLAGLKVPAGHGGDPARGVEIACVNAPANTVVCGRRESLEPVIAELDRRHLQSVLLPGNIAFHSAAMDPIRDDVLAAVSFLDDRPFAADAAFISSVTGEVTERLDGAYWWSNVRRPVSFAAAMETALRQYRPDIVLEVAPHCALQPAIAQCLEGAARAPVCVPTLTRGADACLGFQGALGALFRAGAQLDFAAQYPRPKPISHLLPGHPREEQTSMDPLCDDEMFVRQGGYAHGPLVGHRVPTGHMLFEARLSDRDFPWLADHRVHHAAIMPAAGYIELVLEALGGVPVHFEVIEFLQPCPVPSTPVRLQTALHPVGGAADAFTFTISSKSYELESKSEVHSRGSVRVARDHVPGVPGRLADIDTGGFAPSLLADDRDFYERLEVVLSETFQYGPFFRTVRRVRVDGETRAFLFDVEMDGGLWATGREEGYVASPPLLDGGLQIFLYNLLAAADLFAIPQRAEGVTFLRAPSGPRVTCHVTKPRDDWMDANERGQYSVRPGERSGGSISFYDGVTGDLVAHIGEYIYFTSNPRWKDLPGSRHRISWQPKFVPAGRALTDGLPDGEIGPAALIAAIERADTGADPRACHIVELAGGREPERTVLAACIDHFSGAGGQSEYWLVGDSEETARAFYDAFGPHDATLRFPSVDPAARPELATGLLRAGAAEIVFAHADAGSPGPQQWELARRLAVAGGLMLVRHDEGCAVGPADGWTTVRAGRTATLLQASPGPLGMSGDAELPGPRWVLGEPGSWASDWVAALDGPRAVYRVSEEELEAGAFHSLDEWPGAADLRAVDFFCGDDPGDPTGEKVACRFISFVQALVSDRIEHARDWCRLTVVTRRAAHDVEEPRGSVLWGAARSMALEVGEEARIDFRLVDLGAPADLDALVGIARCDLRERELAVRDGRLWAPRLASVRERHQRLAGGEGAAYRLAVDNAGQIAGLAMKTCELPEPGPGGVEIEVGAAALNFRDVMVALGLLPALAYERSALGHQVGMEAAGVVRRVGPGVRGCRVGDEVAFITGGCIANRAVVDQGLVFRKPARLNVEQAASVLSVYVTAYYSLIHLARLRKGQRVLVHSAMGGVGQAAMALARHVGAEIYATAGSESKRERLLALGATAAFDSRSLDWYDGLMAATGGEGVDAVLNSLAGRHIELCLRALRAGGWHCEIGKVDVYADRDIGLRVFRKNIRFAAIDVDRLIVDDPRLARELAQTCLDLLDEGRLPPLPVTVFPYRDYARALRLMTTGEHQGKLVLKAPPAGGDPELAVGDLRPLFDPDATYLVTGGLGGVGLRLVPYLVACGARHLTLMDRDPRRRRDAAWIRRSSALAYMDEEVAFDIVAGDVAVEADVQRCVESIRRPLKGVFHLAGALDDHLLDDLSAESVARVFAAKAHGALHLHRATLGRALDHFVLFSSTASVVGNPGQINYSAANAFLDGLAASRRTNGLPGLSYNLAAVADAGMAARSLPVLRMMRAAGLPPVSSDFAIANLDYALRAMRDRDHVVTALVERPSWTADSPDYMRIGRLVRNQDAFELGAVGQLTVAGVVAQIAAKVAELCGHDEGGVEEPLSTFGLTSISVAELAAFMQTQFNYRVSALELMTTASALSLAQGVVHGSDDGEEDRAEADAAGTGDASRDIQAPVRRTPSAYANALVDHFPEGPGAQSAIPATIEPN